MRYEVKTHLTPPETMQEAIEYFGTQGVGLELTHQDHACLIFQGGGGHVAVTVDANGGGKSQTTVQLETREWDYPVRKFMGKLH